jgi:hypothetical protein
MPRLTHPALLVATVSMVAGVVVGPTAAYAADPSTALTATEMSAALKAVSPTSVAAAAGGWRATMDVTTSGLSGSFSYIVDPVGGVMFDQFRLGKDTTAEYAVAGKGRYEYLADPTSRSVVRMMGRPSVRYVFTPNKSLRLGAYVNDNAPSPATVLTEDVHFAGTKTVHDDQSVDYRFTDQSAEAITMHIDAAGVLTGAHVAGADLTAVLAYTYGAQHVTLPAPPATISAAMMSAGVAYLSMPASVKDVAYRSAGDARRAAHGHTVKVASLRKLARRDVAASNAADRVKMIKSKSIGGGTRVYATNPWTHKTVSYTLKASGKKVIVTKT